MKLTKYEVIRHGHGGPPDECWLWEGSINSFGYGCLTVSNPTGTSLAHRASYITHVGPIPPGLEIDHKCGETKCWNPTHLRLATRQQNAEYKPRLTKANSSGYRGVSWSSHHQKWKVVVVHKRKHHYLGLFKDVSEAARVAHEKRRQLQFFE